jgi:hypothetical protein
MQTKPMSPVWAKYLASRLFKPSEKNKKPTTNLVTSPASSHPKNPHRGRGQAVGHSKRIS